MSSMGKRPWKTFHFLEANLFVLRYVENSWEDLNPAKLEMVPPCLRLPRITEDHLKKISSFALESDMISFNQQSKQRPVSIVRLARFLQIEVNKIASKRGVSNMKYSAEDQSLQLQLHSTSACKSPVSTSLGTRGCSGGKSPLQFSSPNLQGYGSGNSHLKIYKYDAQCFHVIAGLK